MSAEPAWRGAFRAGGASYLIAGILYIASVVLIVAIGGPPSTGEGYLKLLAGGKLPFQTLVGFFALADILLVPAVLALYLALKEVNRTQMLIASAFWGVTIAADLGTLMVWYSLVPLTDAYVAATGEVQRAAYVAAAVAVLGATNAGFTLAFFLGWGVATIIQSLVMLKGVFSKGVAYLGIIAGIVSLLAGLGTSAVPALGAVLPIWFIIFAVWWLLVGFRLRKIG